CSILQNAQTQIQFNYHFFSKIKTSHMSNCCNPGAGPPRFNGDDPGIKTTAIWMIGILVQTAMVLFFAYMLFKSRTVAGNFAVHLSVATGPPENKTDDNPSDGGPAAPNPGPTSTTGAGASETINVPPQELDPTQTGAPPATSSSTSGGTSGTHSSLIPSQNATQQGASNSGLPTTSGVDALGTHQITPPNPGSTQTGAPLATPSGTNGGSSGIQSSLIPSQNATQQAATRPNPGNIDAGTIMVITGSPQGLSKLSFPKPIR
ncbi:MAG: hypothetical protein Q9168_006221, partial [Polycauliona sp. 1 TL-2023]